MDDLRQRFATLDRVPVPDVWSEVERRREALGTKTPTGQLVAIRPAWRVAANDAAPRGATTGSGRRRSLRLVAAAALITVLLVGGALVVGSGLIRLTSVAPPSPNVSSAPVVTSTQPVPSATTSPSPSPTGPLGGALILVHDLARFGDRSVHDVVALDAATGQRTLLGTLPGVDAADLVDVWQYVFQLNANRDHVLILVNDRLGGVADLEARTTASEPFGFIAKRDVDYGAAIVLSPRGDQIAGVDDFGHPTSIVISDVGGDSRTLELPPGVERLLALAWSPDQSAVVAAGCRPCNTTETPEEHQTADHEHLYIVPLDGSPWRELLDEDDGYLSASWSPDGSTLAVTDFACVPESNMPRCPPGGTSTMSLIDVADGSERRLTSETERTEMAAWSPDGRRIAYVGSKVDLDTLKDGGLYVMNADGTGAMKLADTNADLPPVWSPDSRWLLFKKVWSTTEWWIVPADGGVPRSIGNYGGVAW